MVERERAEPLVCGLCGQPPEMHCDSDAGPMTVCPQRAGQVVGPEHCDDHRTHVIGCLDCALAVCNANDDDLDNFLARMEHIGWQP